MRKLAPMFITTSILALAAGNVLADNTMSSTDKTGSPTVSDNTTKGNMSYSDKSNTAKGTNAKMDDKSSLGVTAGTMPSDNPSTVKGKVDAQNSFATDEDKRDVKPNAQAGVRDDSTSKPVKAKKTKVSSTHHSKLHKDTVATKDDTVTNTGTEKAVKNPPLSATKGEAANSTTGKSAGQ